MTLLVNIGHMVPPAAAIFSSSFNGLMTVICNTIKEHGSCEVYMDYDLTAPTVKYITCDSISGENINPYMSPISESNISLELLQTALVKEGWSAQFNDEQDVLTVSFANVYGQMAPEEDDND
jgi:hypothetical protein